MKKIILINTYHGERGMCTSYELFKIFERIKPQVIFEEMPPSFFNEYYEMKTRSNLETNAINMYLESYEVKHIPVDIYDVPEKFFQEYEKMHREIEPKSLEYRNLIDWQSTYVRQYGFKYLNSIYSIDITSKIDNSIEDTLK